MYNYVQLEPINNLKVLTKMSLKVQTSKPKSKPKKMDL